VPLPKASVSDLRSSTDSIRDTDLMAGCTWDVPHLEQQECRRAAEEQLRRGRQPPQGLQHAVAGRPRGARHAGVEPPSVPHRQLKCAAAPAARACRRPVASR